VTRLVWFYWPITCASVAGSAVRRLRRLGRRSRASVGTTGGRAATGVAAATMPVVALFLAVPVRCSDHDLASAGLRIVPFGIGLLAAVAWLAVIARLYRMAGDNGSDADRSILRTSAVLVLGMPAEFLASTVTLAISCTGTAQPRLVHLTLAAAAFAAAALAPHAATERASRTP